MHDSVFFRANAPVAILAIDSKRFFWAAWTVMKNCRSQFAWSCAQLKESAIRRVVERQLGLYNSIELPVHVALNLPLPVPQILRLQTIVIIIII